TIDKLINELEVYDQYKIRFTHTISPFKISFNEKKEVKDLVIGFKQNFNFKWALLNINPNYIFEDNLKGVMVTVKVLNGYLNDYLDNHSDSFLFTEFFNRSFQGNFLMMLDEPVYWNDTVDKKKTMEYVMRHHKITRVNKVFLDQYEAEENDVIGMSVRDFFEHDIEYGKTVWSNFFDNGILSTVTEEITLKGKKIWIEGNYFCLYDEKGRITGHFGVQMDVTENRLKSRQLASSNNMLKKEKLMFQSVIKSVPDLLFYKDAGSVYMGGNDVFLDHLGIRRNELFGKTDVDFYAKSKANRYLTSDKKVLNTGGRVISNDTLKFADGRLLSMEIIKSPIRDEKGNVLGLIGIARDVTAQLRVNNILNVISKVQEILIEEVEIETAIFKSFKILLETFNLGRVYIYKTNNINKNGKISKAYEMMKGDSFVKINTPGFQNISYNKLKILRWRDAFLKKRLIKAHVVNMPLDEQKMFSDVKSLLVSPIYVQNMYFGFIGFDCIKSEREWDHLDEFLIKSLSVSYGNIIEKNNYYKVIEDQNEELVKTNKELDRFVYSTSHDLRAPIASLLGLVKIMEMEIENREMFGDYLFRQKNAISKLDNFIKDILDYSRNTRVGIQSTPIDFNEMIRDSIMSLSHMTLSDNLQIKLDVQKCDSFKSDNLRWKIIINNLLSNALKFSSFREYPLISINVEYFENIVQFMIEDNGEGMSEKNREKAFEMFYRASENQSGSGLGLYIVKEAIEKLNGKINIKSELNKGTSISISVPCVCKN
ncbi:MAG: PAS domain-containing protein, partial [Cyclobacteriaceae bacterium]|nr:PAS domain-containing protein [Cyclobacteriaceae bacterium]